jgi:hypothetical protein
MKCIFCKETGGPFGTVEHAVPESLGGGDWSVLPPGLVCDGCQKYFGAKIERDALSDAPFHMIRTLLSLPTKKGNAPWFEDPLEGALLAAGRPGQVHYMPSAHIASVEVKTVMRFLAAPRNPRIVCRFLLKMGLEAVAFNSPDKALHTRYDAARAFARRGSPGTKWWYVEVNDPEALSRWFGGGLSPIDESLVELSVNEPVPGAEVSLFKLGPAAFIVPLLPNIYPDADLLSAQHSAEQRTYVV